MNIAIGGKRVIHSYHHYIMSLALENFNKVECSGYHYRSATEDDLSILKLGDFSVANMLPYLRKEKSYSTGLLFFEDQTNRPVGYIWVVRRGGNEMSYRVRNVDALISCVCVFKEYRGQNIANAMISEIVDLLKTENAQKVALGVNTDNTSAVHAYKKAGFHAIGEKKYLRVLRRNIPYHVV